MSLLPASSIGDESTGFYNGVATQSLRFDDGSSDHLTFTPSSASSAEDRRKITHSVWIKRGNIGTYQSIYSTTQNGGGDYYLWRFANDDTMTIYLNVSDSDFAYDSAEVYRDTSNWYHFVLIIDTTQSTDTNRVKLYKNGEQQTLNIKFSNHVSQNFSNYVMDGTEDAIGEFNYNSTTYFDGYMCDFITTIGQDNSISDFGETKNDVWIAKNYSGSYGANGFRLQFDQTGTGTASASTIGADVSGNTNHWTSNNLASGDSNFPDSPENNLAVWNRLIYRRSNNFVAVFSEGNTKVNGTSSQVAHTSSTLASTGKHYAEFYINNSSKSVTSCGVVRTLWDGGLGQSYAGNYGGSYYSTNGTRAYNATSDSQTAPGSDRVGIEVDFANNEVEYFTVASDGTRTSRGGKLNGDDGIEFNGEGVFTATTHDVSTSYIEAYFSESSWHGTPNSGYEELSASKLPETTLSPDKDEQATDYFDIQLWTGTGSGQSFSNFSFQPDWLWFKQRNGTSDHAMFDSTRGVNAGFTSHSTSGENTNASSSQDLVSFDNDGFTTGTPSQYGSLGSSGNTIVTWAWRLNGGTTSSDTNGNRTTTVQTNANAGISIATYNNPSQGNHTFGHGLGSKPEAFIWRARNTIMNWIWWDSHNFTDADRDGKYFNSTIGFTSGSNWVTDVTDSIIEITDGQVSSGNDIDYWCISFKSVEGFSRIGNYTGNGRTDGPFVYTGFRPAWVMFKRIDANNSWVILDNTRSPSNAVNDILFANLSDAEIAFDRADFLSNGFKLRDSGSGVNNSGGTFVYMAFAEQPFKFSNAR